MQKVSEGNITGTDKLTELFHSVNDQFRKFNFLCSTL